MSDLIADVEKFHKAFEQKQGSFKDTELRAFREDLISEEHLEIRIADAENDPVEYLDGLIDLIYVTIGAGLQVFGEDTVREAWKRVQASNMAKIGPKGEILRNESGKVIKPPDWTPPDLSDLV